jgi:hypothetical protein
MIIQPNAEQECKIHEAVRQGLIADEREVLDLGLAILQQRLAEKSRHPATPASKKKTLVELFAPLRGIGLEFDRNPSSSRPVDL